MERIDYLGICGDFRNTYRELDGEHGISQFEPGRRRIPVKILCTALVNMEARRGEDVYFLGMFYERYFICNDVINYIYRYNRRRERGDALR